MVSTIGGAGCSSVSGITGKTSPFSISESDDEDDEPELMELSLSLSLDELSLWLLNFCAPSRIFGCAFLLCFNRRVKSKRFGKNWK